MQASAPHLHYTALERSSGFPLLVQIGSLSTDLGKCAASREKCPRAVDSARSPRADRIAANARPSLLADAVHLRSAGSPALATLGGRLGRR